MYLLDRRGQLAPTGALGEMYVSGAGVARGYLNRPELTAERFLTDIESADPISRMYRSGDIARWRPDGTLEYFGRNDHQVKIRGFRVELGEIEAQLMQFETVKEVIVLAREDVPGEKYLAAYVVPHGLQAGAPTIEALRAHLSSSLPDHMVPRAFVVLESLPLTLNGKLDRRALPQPDVAAYTSRPYEPPMPGLEEILADIWKEVLCIDRVGRNDDFFELGGHSLQGAKLAARVSERFEIQLSPVTFFRAPTIVEMAAVIDGLSVRHATPETPAGGELEIGVL